MVDDQNEFDEIQKAQHIEQIIQIMAYLSISPDEIHDAYNIYWLRCNFDNKIENPNFSHNRKIS